MIHHPVHTGDDAVPVVCAACTAVAGHPVPIDDCGPGRKNFQELNDWIRRVGPRPGWLDAWERNV